MLPSKTYNHAYLDVYCSNVKMIYSVYIHITSSAHHSPDRRVHTAVVELLVVQLGKERKQDLDASYRVDGTVDGVGDNGLHVLWEQE